MLSNERRKEHVQLVKPTGGEPPMSTIETRVGLLETNVALIQNDIANMKENMATKVDLANMSVSIAGIQTSMIKWTIGMLAPFYVGLAIIVIKELFF